MSVSDISSSKGFVNSTINNSNPSVQAAAPQKTKTAAVSEPIFEKHNATSEVPMSALSALFLPRAWTMLPIIKKYYKTAVVPFSPQNDPYTCYIDHYQNMTKRGKEDVSVNSVFRGIFHDCTTALMSEDCERNMKSSHRILEVGAGAIDPKSGTSHLTSHFPKKFEEKVLYSDGNPLYKATQGAVRYECAELTKLSEVFGKETFEHIVSCSVFDVIKWTELENVFKQAYQVLKPNGKLYIYSNIQPLLNMLISYYGVDQNNIVFPLLGRDFFVEGLQILKKDYLSQWLSIPENKHEYPEEVKFLQAYLELNPLEREIFIINVGESNIKYAFSEIIKHLFRNELQHVLNQEFYLENMRQNLLKAGFRINSFGLRSTESIVDSANFPEVCKKDNFFKEVQGRISSGMTYVLAPGKVKLNFSMHAIIAEKVI